MVVVVPLILLQGPGEQVAPAGPVTSTTYCVIFTPGPPVSCTSVGGVQCRVTWLPLIESHDVDGTLIRVGDPGTAVTQVFINPQ